MMKSKDAADYLEGCRRTMYTAQVWELQIEAVSLSDAYRAVRIAECEMERKNYATIKDRLAQILDPLKAVRMTLIRSKSDGLEHDARKALCILNRTIEQIESVQP